jgi:hypothetical protein
MRVYTLKVKTGPGAGKSFEVDSDTVIGREGADVSIKDEQLSRRHVRLHPTAQGVLIEDLGSLNGTAVNGHRVSEPILVTENATIAVGKTELALEFPAAEPSLATVTSRRQPTKVAAAAPDLQTTRASPRPSASGVEAAPPVTASDDNAAAGAVVREPPPAAPPVSPAAPEGRPPPGGRRRSMALAAAGIAALAAGGAVAAALIAGGGASDHKLRVKGVVSVIQQTGQAGPFASSLVLAAQLSGPPGGDGASVQEAPVGADGSFDGTISFYYPKGSFTVRYNGRSALQGGKVVISATGKVVSSAGTYSGASGVVAFTELRPIGSRVGILHARGTIKY